MSQNGYGLGLPPACGVIIFTGKLQRVVAAKIATLAFILPPKHSWPGEKLKHKERANRPKPEIAAGLSREIRLKIRRELPIDAFHII